MILKLQFLKLCMSHLTIEIIPKMNKEAIFLL